MRNGENQVRLNEKGNRSCDKGKINSDQKIDASIAHMSSNDKCPGKNFGDISQLTNCFFRLLSNVPHDTRGFRFYSWSIIRYG